MTPTRYAIAPNIPHTQSMRSPSNSQIDPEETCYNTEDIDITSLDRDNFMDIFSHFSVARELLQQGELEKALAEVDRVVSIFGQSVEALELQIEIRGAIVARNRSPEEEAEIWCDRGNQFYLDRDFENAIKSYDEAIKFKHDYHEAWYNRGNSLTSLGCYEEAIDSCKKAIEFKHDYYKAWYICGILLANLGRYEEAINSYGNAFKCKHDDYQAWNVHGIVLCDNLERYKEAIVSFDEAIALKPNFHETHYNRGVALANLGHYDDAIASYEKTIVLKYDYHEAHYNRGVALANLGRYDNAIESFEKAIGLKHDFHLAWANRSSSAFFACAKTQPNAFTLKHPALNHRGYKGKLDSLTIGLTYCPEAIAQGFLQRTIGDAHSNQARTDVNPGPYWRKALTDYNTSLQSLPSADYPEEHLETLQAAIPALIALQEIESARKFQIQGIQLFNQLRTKTPNKQTFDTKFAKFSHTEIDLLLGENNPIKALEQAEFYKNRSLTWIL
jgi:tetratricopeptide (TPR) repeat protein